MPDQHGPNDSQRLHGGVDIGQHRSEIIACLRLIALAMSTLVECRYHVAPLRQQWRDKIPDAGSGSKAMQQQEGRRIRASFDRRPVTVVQAQAVGGNKAIDGHGRQWSISFLGVFLTPRIYGLSR